MDNYSTVFYFKLNNSNQKFAVQNSDVSFSDLQANIKNGDTIKVYYGSTLLDDYNHIYQIEKDNQILVNYKDYNKSASAKAGVGLFLGILFLTIFIMWFTRLIF